MTVLFNYQRRMAHFVKTSHKPTDDDLSEIPLQGNAADKVRQLSVHINTIHNSLVEVLALNHPLTAQILGETIFRQLAIIHIKKNLPSMSVLSSYGQGFCNVIAMAGDSKHRPYLYDLARLELALIESASSIEPFQPVNFREVAGASQVILDQGVQLLEASYDLRLIVESIKMDQKINCPAPKKTSYYLIYREVDRSVFREISDLEYVIIDLFLKKKPLDEICSASEVSLDVLQQYMQSLCKLGIINAYS